MFADELILPDDISKPASCDVGAALEPVVVLGVVWAVPPATEAIAVGVAEALGGAG